MLSGSCPDGSNNAPVRGKTGIAGGSSSAVMRTGLMIGVCGPPRSAHGWDPRYRRLSIIEYGPILIFPGIFTSVAIMAVGCMLRMSIHSY